MFSGLFPLKTLRMTKLFILVHLILMNLVSFRLLLLTYSLLNLMISLCLLIQNSESHMEQYFSFKQLK